MPSLKTLASNCLAEVALGVKRRPIIPVLLLVLAACAPQTTPDTGHITIITLQAPETLASNEQVRLHATLQGSGTFDRRVTWTATEGSLANAQANPVTYTAPDVRSETVVTLRATSVGDPTRSATVEVRVSPLEPLKARLNQDVNPQQMTIPDGTGNPQPVAGSRDENGVQSDFLVGQVLVKPSPEADLAAFLERYEGTVIGDNRIPEPPAGLGLTLTPEARAPTEYLVRINLARVDANGFAEDAARVGMGGVLEVSSQDGLLTLAGATDARAAGFDVSPNYLSYPDQTFPTALFRSEERPDGAGGFTDAFTTTRFQSTGSQSNVTLAWQFVMAHGVQRRMNVAILDDGFWLNTNGTPQGTDSDFPANPVQYDFRGNDYIADGPNATGCGAGNPCFWHGTGAAGVATGTLNNRLGRAGTGGLIADPMLFKTSGSRAQANWAIRTALAWGADVISMSWSYDCDSVACREFDRDNTPFDDALGAGSRTVFVSSAGNNNHEVGAPYFVHPCIEDHVICVGALNDDATTRIGYSNFGGGVEIYAPTNIPAMPRPAGNDPNPNGPASLQTFGGTSAATPFVAGVAAMMKAINPALNTEDVRRILLETAHPGAAPVTRYLDAYAAVRKAAEGIDGVRDRFEPNGPTLPSQLPGAGPWNEANLGLHNANDRDYYRFGSPQRSTLRLDVAYPVPLGTIPLMGLVGDGACGIPAQTSDVPLAGGGRRLEYTVAAGAHTFSLGGGLISAYNLGISFAPAAALFPDAYEVNNEPSSARPLFSLRRMDDGLVGYLGIDPEVTVDANLHDASDLDYYTVRGASPSLAQQVLLNAAPLVKIYGNESPLTLEVFSLNPDGSAGPLVGSASSPTCDGGALSITLESGQRYLVKVSGGAGTYTLHNGIGGARRRLPELVHDRVYEVLHPLDPIVRAVRTPLTYILIGDRALSEANVRGNVHLELFDAGGNLLAEGGPSGQGFDERLGLEAMQPDRVYALRITPRDPSPEGVPMTLSWGTNPPSRTSTNLILNPGAEEGPGNDGGGAVDFIEAWNLPSRTAQLPTVIYYNGVNDLPNQEDPGPEDRGDRFFAGGPGTDAAHLRQQTDVPGDWRAAIDEGNVKFTLSAFLGGFAEQADQARLSVTFIGADLQELGKVTLGPVTPGEREGRTGLFPVATSDYVPPGSAYIYVDLEFQRAEGDYNDGYADNLEFTLSDHTP